MNLFRRNIKFVYYLMLIASVSVSCVSSKKAVRWDRMSPHFHVQKSQTKQLGKEWVVILPGYSGLKVFKDTGHYFRAAEELNALGFDVMIVEYKKAVRKSGHHIKGGFGERIKWTTVKAIEWAKEHHHFEADQSGHLLSWSAGGEGAILLMNDSLSLVDLGIKSVAMYYPSNRDSVVFQSHIPVLIQSGAYDNVTPAQQIKSTYSNHPNVELLTYPQAHHGFDVSSVIKEKHLQIPPLLGKKFTFKYDEKSAIKSREELFLFLKKYN